LLGAACDQSPIFFEISREVKPTDPRIKGNPTHIVEIGNSLYVASRRNGTIYRYYTGRWSSFSSKGGSILELATDGTYLYALTGSDPMSSTSVSKYKVSDDSAQPDDPPRWEKYLIANAGLIHTIYGAGTDETNGKLFAWTNSKKLVVYDDDTGWHELKRGVDFLNGVAYWDGTYYLAVTGGIYTFDGNTLSESVLPNTQGNVVAVMSVGNRLVALYSGDFLRFSDSYQSGSPVNFAENNYVSSPHFSGSIGLWTDPVNPANSLLLVGVRGGSYSTSHGYREIPLTDGSLNTNKLDFQTPGKNSPSSVNDNDRYGSTIGIHVITALHQAQDGRLFAATTKKGLWSYKERDGTPVWNAEE
jgi:hypothetical protein